MSHPQGVRRTDKLMSAAGSERLLSTAYCGHLGTVGSDGVPYICPLLYVWHQGEVWLHNTIARGHLQDNVSSNPRACFEVELAGPVFAYGRYQCDTSLAYQSVVVFGTIRIVSDRGLKSGFFDRFMEKYYGEDKSRKAGFYPRLDEVTVYAMSVDRMTGKQPVLPAPDQQWPARDQTKSPQAKPDL
jgi:nitroimidazol reductase NimA-like FMN-containing flavoprotein (pyridoxamine 5'-phosphate oxidase superfamily)